MVVKKKVLFHHLYTNIIVIKLNYIRVCLHAKWICHCLYLKITKIPIINTTTVEIQFLFQKCYYDAQTYRKHFVKTPN